VPPASAENDDFSPTDTPRRDPKRKEKDQENHEPAQDEQKPTSVGFFEQISRFSSADWESHIVYVYRLSPITDRLAGGTTKYLMKYGSRFDQDTVKSDHGSGRYRLQLNRSGDKGQSKTIRTYELDVEDVNFPPKVPPGEWLDDPRNKRWAWAKQKIDPTPAATGDPWTPERITRMVKELRPEVTQPQDQMSITKAVLDAVKETRAELGAANNPASMITNLKELILLTKPPDAPTPKPEMESPMYTALMRMLDAADKRAEQAYKDAKEERERAEKDRQRAHDLELADRKHQHELALEQLKQKAEQASPVAMVKEVLNLQKEIGNLGGGDSRNWKEKLVDQGFEALPDILGAAKAFAYSRSAAPPQQPQRPPQQPPAGQAGSQPRPHPSVQTPPPQQQQPVAQQPIPQQTQETQPVAEPNPDPDVEMLLQVFQQEGKRLVAAFAADPDSGPDVAAAIALPMFAGKAGYKRIAAMGTEKIIATIKLLPQMWEDCMKAGTLEMLTDFIDDFCDPDEEEDEPGEEEDDPSRPIEVLPTAAASSSKNPRAPREVKS